jgi:hypothetical protein
MRLPARRCPEGWKNTCDDLLIFLSPLGLLTYVEFLSLSYFRLLLDNEYIYRSMETVAPSNWPTADLPFDLSQCLTCVWNDSVLGLRDPRSRVRPSSSWSAGPLNGSCFCFAGGEGILCLPRSVGTICWHVSGCWGCSRFSSGASCL